MANLNSWAQALTDSRLADDLRRLADNIRTFGTDERDARLREAADRLDRQPQQMLVTMPSGSEVFVHTTDLNIQFQTRRNTAGSWSLPLDRDERPGQPGTVYIGEW